MTKLGFQSSLKAMLDPRDPRPNSLVSNAPPGNAEAVQTSSANGPNDSLETSYHRMMEDVAKFLEVNPDLDMRYLDGFGQDNSVGANDPHNNDSTVGLDTSGIFSVRVTSSLGGQRPRKT